MEIFSEVYKKNVAANFDGSEQQQLSEEENKEQKKE